MENFRADLHCHSTCSDGTMTPEELIRHALEIGLQGLSITDHDTIAAYESAVPVAQRLGLELIPGVEFSASHHDVSVHVLGYSFDLKHPAIQKLCDKHTQRRAQRNQEMLTKLASLGMPLDEAALLSKVNTLGRPHIAQAMIEKGYVDSIANAFRKYLAEGKRAYVRGEIFSVQETIDTIHEAHGLAVIAHPHLVEKTSTLRKLFEMPFDGIECYYSKFTADKNQRWIEVAKKKGWLMTGGSDFHGSIKPTVPLGSSWVGADTFEKLKQWQEDGRS